MTPSDCPSIGGVPVSVHDHALFLDFDGTLAPLQDDPDAVELPTGGAETLLTLAEAFSNALVLISGRDIRDLSARTPQAVWRAGGHGLEVCQPGEVPAAMRASIAPHLRAAVDALTQPLPGVRVEDKGPVLAIHYRQNPGAGGQLLHALSALADETPDYKAQHGKMVIELKPVRANKGLALETLMQTTPFLGRTPIMVGDDTTDEDAMLVAQRLGGSGIKVGEGETCASYRFEDTHSVWDWLKEVANEHA